VKVAGRETPRRLGLAVAAACAALLACPACKVVRDAEQPKGGTGGTESHDQGFDAAAYAGSVWESKAVPFFEKEAVDAATVLPALQDGLDAAGQKYGRRADTEGSPWSFALRGIGTVVSADTESRAGRLVVAIETPRGRQQVALQLGPVVSGTAVRDVLPFFRFGDVANQIQFAQVSRALNDRASAGVRAGVVPLQAPGTRVEFVGALNVSQESGVSDEGEPPLVTPVMLRLAPKGAR
jgi:predicted lipoprotein